MFSDEIMEKILCREEVMRVPCEYKSVMIHAIEEVLEEEKLFAGGKFDEQSLFE